MDIPQTSIKNIPKTAFFDLYNELSHREEQHSAPVTSPNLLASPCLVQTPTKKVQKLQVYSDSPEVEESSPEPFLSKKKPPSELIAVHIPLKSNEQTADFGNSSRQSLDFQSSFRSLGSDLYQSFDIPKVPKSLSSVEKCSKSSSSLKVYMNRLKELDNFDNNDPFLQPLVETKLNSFDSILELIFCECAQRVKGSGCLFLKCSRDGKLSEMQKLDFFYQTLGMAKFEMGKMLHRNLLKKYLFEVTQSCDLPSVGLLSRLGFPEDVFDFLTQAGSPLSFIIAIHVLEIINFSFWSDIAGLGVPFLDICFQLAIEAYDMSKISKLKKFFSVNIVPNYFKLTAAGVLNFFMVKLCRNIDNYELLQKTVEQMRDNHEFLIQSIDPSILKQSN